MAEILSRKPKAASRKSAVSRRQKPQAREKMRACGFSLAACGFSLAASLLTLRLAFLGGRGDRRVTDEDRARLCRVLAGDVDRPTVGLDGRRAKVVARCGAERRRTRSRRTARRARV